MPTISFELDKEDPVVQQFSLGLDAWERPFVTLSTVTERIRARGAVRTRGATPTRGPVQLRASTLLVDDPILQQFSVGLEAWESPIEIVRLG